MIEDRFLTQTFTITNHPVREYEELIQRKYVKALGEFLCFITHADKIAKIIYEHWANSIINTDVISNWVFTPNFVCIKEGLCCDSNDSKHNVLRISFLFDCFYLVEKTKSDFLGKAYIFLARKTKGYFTEEMLRQVYDFFLGANNGDNIPVELKNNRRADIEFRNKPVKKVLVVATMTAGKSTLINALVGNRINKVASMVCTNKIRLVYNKQSDEGAMLECAGPRYIYTDNHNIAQHDSVVNVGVHFRSVLSKERICLLDTPGVNYNGDPSHGEMTRKAVKANDYDVLLFVSNATQLFTNDEANFLEDVIKTCKKKIIICLNQCDKCKPKNDSIIEMVEGWKQTLAQLGKKSSHIVAVSALGALLLKNSRYGVPLTDDEEFELGLMKVKFDRDYYHLEQYCSNYDNGTKDEDLLVHTGILNLEALIYEETKH